MTLDHIKMLVNGVERP